MLQKGRFSKIQLAGWVGAVLVLAGLILTFILVGKAQGEPARSEHSDPTLSISGESFNLTAHANLTAISNYQTFGASGEQRQLTPTISFTTLSAEELSRIGQLTYQTFGCTIKGNITLDDPPLYRYHIRSQNYYSTVVIEPERGERWFCTEADAVKNGWSKSRE